MTRGLLCAITGLALLASLSTDAVVVDGDNITGDFANAEYRVFQDTPTDWGVQRFLAGMYATTNDSALLLGVSAELEWETLTLFIDSDPATGSNVYPVFNSSLDGEERAKFAGMTFDTNFTPDKAITFTHWQDGQSDEGCHIGWHDIVLESSTSWGKYESVLSPYLFTNEGVILAFISGGFIGDTNGVEEWEQGFEFSIPFGWLATATTHVKVMAQIGGRAGEGCPGESFLVSSSTGGVPQGTL